MKMKDYDFSGWATRVNVKCTDGRTIMPNAFKDNDQAVVPLVWNHQHDSGLNVLGHALLVNRPEGVYTYGKFNDTEQGLNAKKLIQNGDISALSIYANQLKQLNGNVVHGNIREVSLVLAGANPEAYIDVQSIAHGDSTEETAEIYTTTQYADLDPVCGELEHADEKEEEPVKDEEKKVVEEPTDETLEHADEQAPEKTEKTVGDIFDAMTEEQKTAVYMLIDAALESKKSNDDEEGEEDMKHNVFEGKEMENENVLSHSDEQNIITDMKKFGSLKESVLAHADTYGIKDIETLFPEPKLINNPPEFISREMGWVPTVMNGVTHSPFSRIKSQFANITEEDARAKGYIKGKLKKEEVFTLLKRSTTPTTIYKKQKLDRDDIIDITDFDVVQWLKAEMRIMLDEEIARAILVGDGRDNSSDDKINELNIRPICKEEDLFNIKYEIASPAADTADVRAKKLIRACVKARKDYKGSGEPTLFTTEDVLTDCLLMEDQMGRIIYETQDKLASAMRVSKIVTVPVMEGLVDANGKKIVGIIVNLKDYKVGADRGGAINFFDDFDIDYNQQKYLIETRISGALVKPYSAITLLINEA